MDFSISGETNDDLTKHMSECDRQLDLIVAPPATRAHCSCVVPQFIMQPILMLYSRCIVGDYRGGTRRRTGSQEGL